jgi:hypothetical protein
VIDVMQNLANLYLQHQGGRPVLGWYFEPVKDQVETVPGGAPGPS